MRKIKITCDSTCDLTRELYEKNAVRVIPLGVSLGDEFCHDGVNITGERIFEYVSKTGELPKTSAISAGEYIDVFENFVNEGYHVIHISLSSEFSVSHANACTAAEEVGNVTVIDSRNLSGGSGLLVLMAAELIEKGLEPDEIADILNEKKEKLDVSFVLQTLEYLHKGGRCSGVAAFGANLLKLRPEIEVVGGKMQVGKKYRGSCATSVEAYVRGRLTGRDDIDTKRIFVTHTGVPAETVEKIKALVCEIHPFEEVIETVAGATVSSHCGPACLGILFFKK